MNTKTEEIVAEIVETTDMISTLTDNAKLKDVVAKLNELIAKVNEIGPSPARAGRDRGPDSTREMTDDDARKVVLGELKDVSHKDAANTLGLSYGQIYSARKGFTFKSIYKELRDSMK